MKALILAAGRGKRVGPDADDAAKCMMPLFGKPLLEYSLENAHRAGLDEIVIVVGYRAEQIINKFGIDYNGIRIRYVIQDEPRGLVHAIDCSREAVGHHSFMLFLADEILFFPQHNDMVRQFADEQLFVLCGTVEEEDTDEIRKTYAVIQDSDSRIYRMIEKPRHPPNHTRGTGNCIFQPGIFDYVELTPIHPIRQEKELPDLIQCAIDDGLLVKSFDIGDGYVNINTPDDIIVAERQYQATPPKLATKSHPERRGADRAR